MSKAVQGRTLPGSPEREAIAQKLFKLMIEGPAQSAFQAAGTVGIPLSTFTKWCNEDSALGERYAQARDELIERIAGETISIADAPVPLTPNGATDNGAVQKQRLQVDTRKWLLSKLAPKKFGDKVTLAGDSDSPLSVERIERVIVKPPNG